MGTGYLKVFLTSGEQAVPVADATVIIRDVKGTIIRELVTNDNGVTEEVTLEAPDSSYTYDPYYKGDYYRSYQVNVLPINGYSAVNVTGVQVYDQETSILPVNMTPIYEKKRKIADVETIEIPSEIGVEMGGTQREIDIMQAPMAFTEVIIPEYMTVHLGRPNADAENVRVKFIDYIKNVASSEIFPTWPEESLRANIYAQISFALNRVFTVWYRSRGFSFDITNSTTVDQYFVYGRNIFQNISDIVDEIFNNYIRRKGRLEPFFAQYCNGTTSTCDGLSQWGTVPLAEQGKSAIEILKYYYPNDIEIIESNNFSSRVETYPGSPLRVGSTGKDVLKMQTFLNRIRVNYPLIPQITRPDGIFGAETENAVRVFQTTFSLPRDGVIGKNTWYIITSVFVAVTKLAELTSEGIRIGIGATPPTSVIKMGSRGEDVVELQFILNYISYFYPSIPTVIQDGYFGETTKRSVIEFQKEFGLTPDGVVGPGTWNKLYAVYKSLQDVVNPPSPDNPTFPGTALRVGSRGNDVLIMQQFLNDISDVYTSIPKLTEDGVFGTKMETSVKAFQRQFGLTQDGVIGEKTWNKIVEVRNNLDPNQINPPFPGSALRVGSRGEDVRIMQTYLNAIANVYTSIPNITADGVFGPNTERAVIAFQKVFGLTPDGIIGENTWNRIVLEYNNLPTYTVNPPFPGTALRVGSSGSNVELMQKYLNVISTVYPSIPRLVADGRFGPKTQDAVIAFQRQFGLTPDGVIGKLTWNKIVTEYDKINSSQRIIQAYFAQKINSGI